MSRYQYSPAEKEILTAYKEQTSACNVRMTGARRMLMIANPDAILLASPDDWYEVMEDCGILLGGISKSQYRSQCIYGISEFRNWLEKKFNAGEHLDTWFEPEWMEAHSV